MAAESAALSAVCRLVGCVRRLFGCSSTAGLLLFGGYLATVRLLLDFWFAAVRRLVGYCSAFGLLLFGILLAAVRRLVDCCSAFGLLLFGS